MPAQTTNLLLLEDLEDVGRTSELAESDLDALHATSDWIKTFVVKPHKDLGRAGTVCPFVPVSLERKTLWLAAEQIADRDAPEVVELMNGYKTLLLDTQPTDGDDVIYNTIVVVFSDLPADRAQGVFDEVLQQLAVPSYVEDGILFGPYYEGNEGTALYNSSFRPFQSPVPFLFVRHGVISDWKFFLDNEDWLTCGHVAMENPQSTLLLRNYAVAVARGARLIREWPRFERSHLAGVARLGGNLDLFPKSVPRGVMPVAHHPEATASAMKFPGAYSHGMCEARGRRVRGHRARRRRS